jgi:hypothetical protein
VFCASQQQQQQKEEDEEEEEEEKHCYYCCEIFALQLLWDSQQLPLHDATVVTWRVS